MKEAAATLLLTTIAVAVLLPAGGCGSAEDAETTVVEEAVLSEPDSDEPAMSLSGPVEPRPSARDFERRRETAVGGDWLMYGGNPVLSNGVAGAWDDFRAGSPVVMQDREGYRMWYRGCRFLGLDYTCGIGHAASVDGIVWEKGARPVFVPAHHHESARLNALAVVRAGGDYLLWYSVDADRFANRPYATLHLIRSTDGLQWRSEGLVLRAFSQYKSPIMHAALHDGGRFHLWYADFPSGDDDEVLMHLISDDGTRWQMAGTSPLKPLGLHPGRISVWSDGAGGYRALFARPFQSPRWPNYDQRSNGLFGSLESPDGNTWHLVEESAVLAGALGTQVSADSPTVVRAADGHWVWFAMHEDRGTESLGLAWHKPLPQERGR